MTDLPFVFCLYFLQPGSREPSPSVHLTETLNCFLEQSVLVPELTTGCDIFLIPALQTQWKADLEFEASQGCILRLETVSNKI